MDPRELHVDADIAKARSLPAEVYADPRWYGLVRERVFARTWHMLGDVGDVPTPGSAAPFVLLEGLLSEPLVVARDRDGVLRCLSNVCTHRGNRVCDEAGAVDALRCRYHGRRFGLDGRFQSMPAFGGVAGFPSAADDLAAVPHATWRQFLVAGVAPSIDVRDWLAPLEARVGWLPIDRARLDRSRSRDYEVAAHWALYCDNYLEGFHVPFVHAGLARALDVAQGRIEIFRYGSVQIGVAREGDVALTPPPSSPDAGERIAAYYFWLFPATMVNVYPWGISFNLVKPLGPDRTRVSFLSYVWDAALLGRGAGGDLHTVEMEDEAVVESVQRGVRSRFFRGGRYAPAEEQGVHHFHRLLVEFLQRDR